MAVVNTPRTETMNVDSRLTVGGRRITYQLTVIQQPERARACGSGAKSSADRRPVDPPPIVGLRIFEGEEGALEEITFSYKANFFLYVSLEPARPIAQGRVPQTAATFPVLTGMPVSGMAYLDRPQPAGYFLFPDLAVRHEGKYRLSFNLYEETKDPHDADVEPAPGQPATPRVRARLNTEPGAPQSYVDWRLKVDSHPFTVFSAKKFPGLAESTSLSRIVAEQGCRVRIRRDVRMRRRDHKAPARFDDDDHDDEDEDDDVAVLGGGPEENEPHGHHFHHPPTLVPDVPDERALPTEVPTPVDPHRLSNQVNPAAAAVMPPPPTAHHLEGHRASAPVPAQQYQQQAEQHPQQQQQYQQHQPAQHEQVQQQHQQQQQQPQQSARDHASMYNLEAYRRASHEAPPSYNMNAYPPPYHQAVPPQTTDMYPPRHDAPPPPPPGPYQYHQAYATAVPPPPPPPPPPTHHHPSMSDGHATSVARGPAPPSPHMSERVERGSTSRRPSMSGPAPPAPAPPAAVSAYGYHDMAYARPPSVPPRSYGNASVAMPRTSTPGVHEHPLPPLNVAIPVDAPRYSSTSASATVTAGTPPAPPSANSLSSSTTATHHSARAPKRPYGTVFDASQLDASLRHGMRPSEETHGLEPLLVPDEEDESSTALDLQRLRMQYKRADGTEIRRRPPHTQ